MERQEELCAEVNEGAPSFLESGEGTDCKFMVGAEPHQVVVGGYKLVMAMASPVFKAMFYGSLAETRDHIPLIDVVPEIFKAMLRYIYSYTGNIKLSSCNEAVQMYYTAKKYMLHHLMDECSNYLQNNVDLGNVCQLNESSQLYEDEVLTQKCINVVNVENNVKGLIETQNATDGPEQATPGYSDMTNVSDTVDQQQIRSVVKHIRFLTLTPQQYIDCTARASLLTLLEDHAVLVNIVSNKSSAPMPSGLSTSRVSREIKARSEATFRYTVQNFSSLENEVMSPMFYVRNLPWQIKTMPRATKQTKSLGFFVQCSTASVSSSWSCNATVVLRLICHKPGAEPYPIKIKHLFTKAKQDWGFPHFIAWDTVLDPTQGYIQNNAITLEVHITADEPQGVV